MKPRIKPGRLPQRFHDVLSEHRTRLKQVTDGGGLKRMERFYMGVQAELESKLRKLVKAGRGSEMTASQARLLLAQARQGQAQIAQELAG